MEDRELEDLFVSARSASPEPSAGFVARVLEQAYEAQPASEPSSEPVSQISRGGGWLAGFLGAGWWRGALPACLAMITLAGVWIGLSAGDALALEAASVMESDLALELVYRFPALGGWMGEI